MSLSVDYNSIRVAISDFLGWGRNSEGAGSAWSTEEQARMEDIIKSGLNEVYYPEGGHQWSWMRPISTITTSAPYSTGTISITSGVVTLTGGTFPAWSIQGEIAISTGTYTIASRDSDTQITLDDTGVSLASGSTYSMKQYLYDLPSDFSGFEGDIMTYKSGQSEVYPPVRLVSDHLIRESRQRYVYSERPSRASIRPKTFDPTVGSRWELAFWPSPDGAYDLEYPYKVEPSMLDATNKYPLGGAPIGELVLQACLSVAERRYRDEENVQTNSFMKKLAASIQNDSEMYAPDNLGYNSENTEFNGTDYDRRRGDGTHSFEGNYYH